MNGSARVRRGALGRVTLAVLLAGSLARPASAAGAARGQPSLNVYFQSTLKDDAYQQRTFKRVAAVWKAPSAAAFPKIGAKAVVRAVIAKDGRLVSTEVSTASGSKAWDQAVEKAVRAAAPYDPLPAGYAYPSLEAHFHVSCVAVPAAR